MALEAHAAQAGPDHETLAQSLDVVRSTQALIEEALDEGFVVAESADELLADLGCSDGQRQAYALSVALVAMIEDLLVAEEEIAACDPSAMSVQALDAHQQRLAALSLLAMKLGLCCDGLQLRAWITQQRLLVQGLMAAAKDRAKSCAVDHAQTAMKHLARVEAWADSPAGTRIREAGLTAMVHLVNDAAAMLEPVSERIVEMRLESGLEGVLGDGLAR
jgi:hypothetical protein